MERRPRLLLLRGIGVEDPQRLRFVLIEIERPLITGKNHPQCNRIPFRLYAKATESTNHIEFITEATGTAIKTRALPQYRQTARYGLGFS